jgi:hypothetical protein
VDSCQQKCVVIVLSVMKVEAVKQHDDTSLKIVLFYLCTCSCHRVNRLLLEGVMDTVNTPHLRSELLYALSPPGDRHHWNAMRK